MRPVGRRAEKAGAIIGKAHESPPLPRRIIVAILVKINALTNRGLRGQSVQDFGIIEKSLEMRDTAEPGK